MSEQVSVIITQKERYQFVVDFGEEIDSLIADEPAPLGDDKGPAPTHLLLAGVANCLSASLFFALSKFKQDADGIQTTARCTVDRNAEKRLRVLRIDVDMHLGKPGAQIEHLDRILGQFEEFCTVSQSVRAGIPIHVSVRDGDGVQIK